MDTVEEEYIAEARKLGYDASDELLIEVGMAIERGQVEWSWYEAGEERNNAVSAVFEYSNDKPTEAATVAAYAEGTYNELA